MFNTLLNYLLLSIYKLLFNNILSHDKYLAFKIYMSVTQFI